VVDGDAALEQHLAQACSIAVAMRGLTGEAEVAVRRGAELGARSDASALTLT